MPNIENNIFQSLNFNTNNFFDQHCNLANGYNTTNTINNNLITGYNNLMPNSYSNNTIYHCNNENLLNYINYDENVSNKRNLIDLINLNKTKNFELLKNKNMQNIDIKFFKELFGNSNNINNVNEIQNDHMIPNEAVNVNAENSFNNPFNIHQYLNTNDKNNSNNINNSYIELLKEITHRLLSSNENENNLNSFCNSAVNESEFGSFFLNQAELNTAVQSCKLNNLFEDPKSNPLNRKNTVNPNSNKSNSQAVNCSNNNIYTTNFDYGSRNDFYNPVEFINDNNKKNNNNYPINTISIRDSNCNPKNSNNIVDDDLNKNNISKDDLAKILTDHESALDVNLVLENVSSDNAKAQTNVNNVNNDINNHQVPKEVENEYAYLTNLQDISKDMKSLIIQSRRREILFIIFV